MRRFWPGFHRSLGLALGAFLVLSGLTGAINVWRTELDAALNPELLRRSAPGPSVGADIAIAAAAAVLGRQPDQLMAPLSENGVYSAWVVKRSSDRWKQAESKQVLIDPSTGRVTGERTWGKAAPERWALIPMIHKLHYTLLADFMGVLFLGITGLFTLSSLSIGVYLWCATARARAKASNLAQRLHRTVGIYSVGVLIVSVATGVTMSLQMVFPDEVKGAVSALLPMSAAPKHASAPRANGTPSIGADTAIGAALASFPEARWVRVRLPRDAADVYGVYEVIMRQPGELREHSGYTRVWIDRYSGKVLGTRDALRAPAGEKFFDALHPIHSGEALGWAGKIALSAAGLAPLALAASGVLLWRRRRVRFGAVLAPHSGGKTLGARYSASARTL